MLNLAGSSSVPDRLSEEMNEWMTNTTQRKTADLERRLRH